MSNAMPLVGATIYALDAVVSVRRGPTDAASGLNLAAAYAAAAALTPGGNALSASNRAVVLIPPGGYSLSSTLDLDTDFVDLVAMAPAMGGPLIDTDVEWTGPADAATSVTTHFRPPPTLIYSALQGNSPVTYATVKQTADDVRLSGFGIANLSDPGVKEIYGYYAVADVFAVAFLLSPGSDNAASVYDRMYFWVTGPGVAYVGSPIPSGGLWMRFPVLSMEHLDGHWSDCVANGWAWRVTKDMELRAKMDRCIAGGWSFAGDASGASIGATARLRHCRAVGWWNEAAEDAITAAVVHSGYASFGGCKGYGVPIAAGAILEDCSAGDRSFGLARPCAGTFRRCRGGEHCFAGQRSEQTGITQGVFSGYAEDCVASGNSFGGGDQANDYCSGTLERCINTDRKEPLQCNGATMRNCRLNQATDNIDAVILIGDGSTFYNCEITVFQGGTGIPINDDGNARTMSAAHCRMNNATNDGDGIGANVTNDIGVHYNVVDDQV